LLKLGLTGGVACGKSTVGEMFVSLGAHLVKADEIAHKLMQPGEKVYSRVVQAFGKDILNADGTINRPRLADAVFPTGRISELNAIVHPAVIEAQEDWMQEQIKLDPNAVVIVEAALLLEAGSWNRFDRLVTVTCPLDQKVERFAARHNLSLEKARAEVERRQKAQASDDDKVKISDYVIDNSGTLEQTRQQVQKIWDEVVRLA
jgi:dephospho-CoA kinase